MIFPPLTIATEADLPDIVDIYNATIPSRMVTADIVPITVESRLAWFANHVQNRPILVARQDGKIIAWSSFSDFYGRPAYAATAEVSIYVHNEFQQLGLGKNILQQCIALAPSIGIKTLLAIIFAHNKPSIQLFEKFGFEKWGLLPNIAELDNEEYSVQILGLRLR